ncbi:integral membrane protein [Colletotrichum asianum]
MAVSDKYSLAVLIIFITLSIPTLFVTFKHGVRGWAILGWGYLFIFCSLKIIGSGMALGDPESSGATIVSSVGLSPLLLALSGVLHEARFYYTTSPSKRSANHKRDLIFVLMFHMFTMLGVVLIAIGMSRLMNHASPDDVSKGWTLAKVGAVVLFLSWVALAAGAAFTVFQGYMRSDGRPQKKAAVMLLTAVLFALPFVGVRVIATLAYVASENSSLSAATGSVMVKVWLYLFEELAATLILVINGVLARNVKKLDQEAVVNGGWQTRPADAEQQAYERNSSPSTFIDTFEASDFALFNHFLTTTLPCLALKNEALLMSWKSDLPNLAPKFPYLLHEVLAVSAIHLHHLNPSSSINYQRVAWGHQAKAFSQFRDALSPEVAAHQVHALFACSALMSNSYFASFEDPSLLLFNSDPPGPPEWIFPVRGCATLVRQLRGPLEASTSWTALQSSLDTWSVSPPSPEGPEWEPELQSMEAKLSVLSHGTDPRPLYEDFQLLRECFKIAGKAGDASCKVSAMMFGGAASEEFLKNLTERKRPETLVMMAFWCVLISRVNQRHWLRSDSVPEAILGVIEAHLPPEYLELIRWPAQQIRSSHIDV